MYVAQTQSHFLSPQSPNSPEMASLPFDTLPHLFHIRLAWSIRRVSDNMINIWRLAITRRRDLQNASAHKSFQCSTKWLHTFSCGAVPITTMELWNTTLIPIVEFQSLPAQLHKTWKFDQQSKYIGGCIPNLSDLCGGDFRLLDVPFVSIYRLVRNHSGSWLRMNWKLLVAYYLWSNNTSMYV